MPLTPSDFGKLCELRARDFLVGSVPVEEYNYPYDLTWNGQRVEVKGTRKGYHTGYLYGVGEKFAWLLVFCDEVKKVYFIPNSELKKRGFHYGNLNVKKYSEYEIDDKGIYDKTKKDL